MHGQQDAKCKSLIHFLRPGYGSYSDALDVQGMRSKTVDYRKIVCAGGESLKMEKKRLETFAKWPKSSSVKPEALAKSGFHYLGVNDRVQCVFCRGVLHSWVRGDDAMKEHKRAFGTCPFIIDMDVGNIPIPHEKPSKKLVDEPLPHDLLPRVLLLRDNPSIPYPAITIAHWEFRTEASRVESFQNWSNSPIKPLVFAVSGFYYIGQGDTVCCFCCGLALGAWCAGDNPQEEHKRLSPACRYLRGIAAFDDPVCQPDLHIHQSQVQYNFTDDEIQARMDTWVVRKALELKFSEDMVRFVLERNMRQTGEDFLSVDKLLDHLFALKEDMEEENITELSIWKEHQQNKKLKMREEKKQKGKDIFLKSKQPVMVEYLKDPDIGFTHLDTEKMNTNDEELQRKINDSLRNSQTCKVCMDQPMNVIFMPCNHIVSCQNCAQRMQECPLCRKKILQTVTTSLGGPVDMVTN